MSLDPMLWANKDAPVANVQERAILTIMGERAHEDGTSSYLAQATIAKRALVNVRTVRRCLAHMEERGLIARGDQRVASHIPAARRPVVYDLMIPYAWFSNISRVNDYRMEHGRPPLTAEMRPPIAAPPPPKQRADLGVPRPRLAPGETYEQLDETYEQLDETYEQLDESGDSGPGGLQVPPYNSDEMAGLQVRGDYKSTEGGLQVHGGGTTSPPTLPYNSPLNSPPTTVTVPSGPTAPDGGPAATEGGKISRFDDQTRAVLAAAADAAVAARAGGPTARAWSREAVTEAMLQAIDADRDPDDVAWIIKQAARDSTTNTPNRILQPAWWEIAIKERFVPAPPPPARSERCPRHWTGDRNLAGDCQACRTDERVAELEQARARADAAEQADVAEQAEVDDGEAALV
jgi:hypothetical protein